MTDALQTIFGQATKQDENLSPKQQAVLAASLELFAQKGYDATSTADIAHHAGVSEGTIFKRFRTKEGLLQAILGPFLNRVMPQAAGAFVSDLAAQRFPHFKDLLTYGIQDRIRFVMENRAEMKIFIQEIGKNPELLVKMTNMLADLLRESFDDIFKVYQDNGELVRWESMRIMRYCTSVMIGYLIPNVIMDDQPVDCEKVTNDAVEFLCAGLTPRD
ncbi:TetR/AcrR family transcriptional regulator [Lacticaseibacillus porcinae]|uniref:TetR/AcrR family transcriptional regulator n=1 Tax=Lacticaseibacillus porcinae TaxID=1123687 RepID=UPI0013DE30C4|nr:TetR/AcrR family transcriptional regulator [Lacticaseibacillus porcinae]